MRLALFEPEIAGNVGAAIRIAACFAAGLDVIEPCGFPASDRSLRRAAMDYADGLDLKLHADWAAFDTARRAEGRRLTLLTTRADADVHETDWRESDIVLIGRESSGVPQAVHAAADRRARIPMAPGARSLNMAVAAAVALADARRRLGFPAT